jgi:hypothetical protein
MGAEVLFAALCREGDLFLPLAETRFSVIARGAIAAMAAHPIFIFRTLGIFGQDGLAAGMAEHMRSLNKPVANRNTPVKDKAIALPRALVLWDFFEVF